MADNPYDKTCRKLTRRYRLAVLRWLLSLTTEEIVFVRCLDTRGIPSPWERDRTSDTVAFLRDPGMAGLPWAVVVEFQLDPDALYEFGTQPATFARPRGFGEWTWRYTIPGHGCARWGEVFAVLKDHGYGGVVSIELEDEQFNGTDAGEQAALIYSRDFLRSV